MRPRVLVNKEIFDKSYDFIFVTTKDIENLVEHQYLMFYDKLLLGLGRYHRLCFEDKDVENSRDWVALQEEYFDFIENIPLPGRKVRLFPNKNNYYMGIPVELVEGNNYIATLVSSFLVDGEASSIWQISFSTNPDLPYRIRESQFEVIE